MKQNGNLLEIIIGDMKLSVIDANDPPDARDSGILPHFHSLYEFQYIEEGTAVIGTNKGNYSVAEGSFVMIPDRLYHWTEYRSCNFRRSVYLMSVEQSGSRSGRFSEYGYYAALLARLTDIMTAWDGRVTDMMQQIGDFSKELSECTAHKRRLYFGLLFVRLMEYVEKYFPAEHQQREVYTQKHWEAGNDPVLRTEITDFVARHYAEDNLLDKLANQLKMSRRHTTRIVGELFHMPLSALILRQRMNCAYGLIRETEESLQGIGEKIGYHSYSSFYRTFRQYYGCSPEMMRRK